MQRVLVLNADGFIGRGLTVALRQSAWAIPIAAGYGPAAASVGGGEYRQIDITDESEVAGALAGIDAVIHCVPDNHAQIAPGARALFAAAARANTVRVPKVVHISTITVYGDATGLMDERAPLRGADHGAYGAARMAAEQLAAAYPRVVILRPGLIYGPHSPQWSIQIGDLLMARRLGDVGADGDGYCNLVHIDDVAAASLRCLQSEHSGMVFNLGALNPPTWNEYLIRYGRALNAVPIRRISHRRLTLEAKVVAPPLKILELALKAARLRTLPLPPFIPPSLLGLMRQEIKLDVTRAVETLGLRFTPLETGIEATARWYLQRKAV